MKYYWVDNKWVEAPYDIVEETNKKYVMNVSGLPLGYVKMLEIDVTEPVKKYFGGDIEAFKKSLKGIKVD